MCLRGGGVCLWEGCVCRGVFEGGFVGRGGGGG